LRKILFMPYNEKLGCHETVCQYLSFSSGFSAASLLRSVTDITFDEVQDLWERRDEIGYKKHG